MRRNAPIGTRCHRDRSRENRVSPSSSSTSDEDRVYNCDVSTSSSMDTGVGSLSAGEEEGDDEVLSCCAMDNLRFLPPCKVYN